eukprot:scaffold7397_cov277-Pinguiococcus_pyrenoidosus.AAC.3
MPGKEGYLRWYIDDEMIHSINGTSLKLMGSKIPEEPSYLILNTAVSTTWGFPMPCPKGCDCSCYDCKKNECLCGMPPGMCKAFERADLDQEDDGARFLVDYVRIYQDPDDSRHTVGCDPPDFPTRRYIQAHALRYAAAAPSTRPLQVNSRLDELRSWSSLYRYIGPRDTLWHGKPLKDVSTGGGMYAFRSQSMPLGAGFSVCSFF